MISIYFINIVFVFFVQVPSREVDKSENKFWTHWNKDTKQFFLQFAFKNEPLAPPMGAPHLGQMRPPHMLPPPMSVPPPPMFNPVPPPPPNLMLAPPPPPAPLPPPPQPMK